MTVSILLVALNHAKKSHFLLVASMFPNLLEPSIMLMGGVVSPLEFVILEDDVATNYPSQRMRLAIEWYNECDRDINFESPLNGFGTSYFELFSLQKKHLNNLEILIESGLMNFTLKSSNKQESILVLLVLRLYNKFYHPRFGGECALFANEFESII